MPLTIATNNSTATSTLAASWTSDIYQCGPMISGSLELIHAAGVTGNFYIEVSNSGTNFYTVDGTTVAANDLGLFWNITNLNSRYVRIGYSGSTAAAVSIYNVMKIHGSYRMEQR